MKTNIKIGLITGIIAMIINIIVSGLMGICGPVLALLAGTVAGIISGRSIIVSARSEGARNGAVSAGIVGAFTLTGQIIGSFIALLLVQTSHIDTLFGKAPAMTSGTQNVIYYLSGLGISFCFGLTGIILSALAGAAAGYLSAKMIDSSAAPLPVDPPTNNTSI